MPNIGKNAVAKSMGTVNRMDAPQREMKKALKIMTEGIEMISVVVWKKALPPPLTCSGDPFTTSPLGMKKLVEATRSINCMMMADSSGGNASSKRKAVTNCAQTKKGRRIQVRPGARSWIMVVMKLTAPSSEEVIRKINPISQSVWPSKTGLNPGP